MMPFKRIGHSAIVLVAMAGLTSLMIGEPPVRAQPPACASVVGGEPGQPKAPWVPKLTVGWTETEGDWHGTWQPLQDYTGHYHATYSKGRERTEADISIIPDAVNHVTIRRRQAEGECTYDGYLTNDRWHVAGTYVCTWGPRQLHPFSAAIGRGFQPADPCAPAVPVSSDPRLSAIWHEQEGDWAGEWTPVEPLGDFRGGWHKGQEWANANLHITIAGSQITVIRSQPAGRCTYSGSFTGNGWQASGTYNCPWRGGYSSHSWSATIGDGHPPAS